MVDVCGVPPPFQGGRTRRGAGFISRFVRGRSMGWMSGGRATTAGFWLRLGSCCWVLCGGRGEGLTWGGRWLLRGFLFARGCTGRGRRCRAMGGGCS